MKSFKLFFFCSMFCLVSSSAVEPVVHPGEPSTCELCALRAAMEKSVEPAVYYSTVKDSESRKVRLIRFESVGGGPVKQSYADPQPTRTKNWEHAILQVKGPAQTNELAVLRASVARLKASDAGKLILFEDRSGLGIGAESLGLLPSPMPMVLKEAIEKAKMSSADPTAPK